MSQSLDINATIRFQVDPTRRKTYVSEKFGPTGLQWKLLLEIAKADLCVELYVVPFSEGSNCGPRDVRCKMSWYTNSHVGRPLQEQAGEFAYVFPSCAPHGFGFSKAFTASRLPTEVMCDEMRPMYEMYNSCQGVVEIFYTKSNS